MLSTEGKIISVILFTNKDNRIRRITIIIRHIHVASNIQVMYVYGVHETHAYLNYSTNSLLHTCNGSTAMRAVNGPLFGITIGSGSIPRAKRGLSVMTNTLAPRAFTC